MKCSIITFCILAIGVTAAEAADLYKIDLPNEVQATQLRVMGITPMVALTDGYLILVEKRAEQVLAESGVPAVRVAVGIEADELAIDRRPGRDKSDVFPLVFSQESFRLVRVSRAALLSRSDVIDLIPLEPEHVILQPRQPGRVRADISSGNIDLDSLINLVSRDTIEAEMQRMEAFGGRLTGTDSCYAARDWLAAKFQSFGYDSVVIDSFIGSQLWARVPVPSQNVVAVKPGSKYPDAQIIVGGHFDVVPDCPGADDNASGTVGTLEIARILSTLETDMTFVFIAFDSEESWLWGSQHYADEAVLRGDNIVYMMNLDMIAHLPNDSQANLYCGSETAPSELWRHLADSLVGISAVMAGSTASDHYPFQQYGYPVTFVQERIFSSEYHCRSGGSDDIYHINFEYMTRMIKASLATVYAINQGQAPPAPPPPVMITSVRDVGDGQSLRITWQTIPCNRVDHLELHYGVGAPSQVLTISSDSTYYTLSGLTEGAAYTMHMTAVDTAGTSSLVISYASGTPLSKPQAPENLAALPLRNGIRLDWTANNLELDFSHYTVIRDGILLLDSIHDLHYVDDDPSLGNILHQYRVRAVDFDGNLSDTTGIAPVVMKAATLDRERILAVNRSHRASSGLVDEMLVGQFLQEALHGLSFDYYSDTAYAAGRRIGLMDMIDYGLLVLGGESGRGDNFGLQPELGGILDLLSYYASLGGKIIIFGRWGDIYATGMPADTVAYPPESYTSAYAEYFNITARILPFSKLQSVDGNLYLLSDLVGAHSRMDGYPDLVWDSAATLHHTGASYAGVSGIPCPSFPLLGSDPIDTLYTYDSKTDSVATEGQVIGWRSLGGPHDYVFFEFPLTFMDHAAAVAALRKAIDDMGISTAVDDRANESALPNMFTLAQNYPNPFNPATTIEFRNPEARPVPASITIYNILGQEVRRVFDGPALPGLNRVVWDGRDERGQGVATGIYFYRLKTDRVTMTKKMILLK